MRKNKDYLTSLIGAPVIGAFFIFNNAFAQETVHSSELIVGLQASSNKLNSFVDDHFDDEFIAYDFQLNKESISLRFKPGLYDQELRWDDSFIEYDNDTLQVGLGFINRHWSFSPYSSIALSNNSQPFFMFTVL